MKDYAYLYNQERPKSRKTYLKTLSLIAGSLIGFTAGIILLSIYISYRDSQAVKQYRKCETYREAIEKDIRILSNSGQDINEIISHYNSECGNLNENIIGSGQ